MSWDYRVIKTDVLLLIAEVYYNKNNQPNMYCWAMPSVDVEGSIEEIREELNLMSLALDKPILRYPEDFDHD